MAWCTTSQLLGSLHLLTLIQFSVTDSSRQEDVNVDYLSQEEGVYIWIHDGKIIAGETKLTEELRKIFGIEEKKEQLIGCEGFNNLSHFGMEAIIETHGLCFHRCYNIGMRHSALFSFFLKPFRTERRGDS